MNPPHKPLYRSKEDREKGICTCGLPTQDYIHQLGWPLLVIATSEDRGEAYAKFLGLVNYKVHTEINKVQGMRVRGVVVTPEYIALNGHNHVAELELFYVAFQVSSYGPSEGMGYISKKEENNG